MDYARADRLLRLATSAPLFAQCALQWVRNCLADRVYCSRAALLCALPLFLQLLVVVAGAHAALTPDCFSILEASAALRSDIPSSHY